jgi:hypothetical protein
MIVALVACSIGGALASAVAEARPLANKPEQHTFDPMCDTYARCAPVQVAARVASADHRHTRQARSVRHETQIASVRGYCTEATAAGPITIDCALAPRMKGFIADVVARGFQGRVHCFSLSRTHVPGSLHKTARACDFAQHGWNKTVRVMYRVGDLAAKWGLRDGCSFGGRRGPDCGHIDGGGGRNVASADPPLR